MEKIDRYKGSLLGLAVGEALGAPLKGKKPGASFRPLSDGQTLMPGLWSDGCAMAMCIAGSLVKEGFNPLGQIERYWKLFRQGYVTSKDKGCWKGIRFDAAMRKALARFEKSREPYCGLEDAASASPVKRLAPVPLYFAKIPQVAVINAGSSARTTHGAMECVEACRYLAALIVGAVAGFDKDKLLSENFEPVEGIWRELPFKSKIKEIAAGSFKLRRPPTINAQDGAFTTLEAALWAFHNSSTFAEGALLAVNLGDDTDVTGAVYGQLAGAFYGIQNIPDRWLWNLSRGEAMERQAEYIFHESKNIYR